MPSKTNKPEKTLEERAIDIFIDRLRNRRSIDYYPDQLPLKKAYTLKETAAIFIIGVKAINRLIEDGELDSITEPIPIGRPRKMITIEAIEKYAKAHPEARWILERINRNWDGTGYSIYREMTIQNAKRFKIEDLVPEYKDFKKD